MSVVMAALAVAGVAYAAEGVFPYPIVSKTLENGLQVQVVSMPTPGVAAVYTWMAVGSRDEIDPGRSGFAHFCEHLMFYGTPTVPREAREREILLLGADENAWTYLDETAYHAVLSSASVPRYLEIQGDLFQHLTLTEADVRRESGAVYGEFRKGQSDPDSRLSETLQATAFTVHPYGHDTIGYEADIAAMPTALDYGQRFFQRMYRPENARVLVVGDVKPEVVFAEVEKHWASWTRGSEARPVIPVEPAQTEKRTAAIAWPTATNPRLAFGFKTPGRDAGEAGDAALQLLGEVLLSPNGSLHRRLVESGDLAYNVYGGANPFVDPGLFTIFVDVKDPAKLADVEAIVNDEIAKAKVAVDPAFLTATRQNSRYSFLVSLDEPDRVANAVGWAMRRSSSPTAIDDYYAAYDAVTPEQVSEAARQYLVETGLTVVTLTAPVAK